MQHSTGAPKLMGPDDVPLANTNSSTDEYEAMSFLQQELALAHDGAVANAYGYDEDDSTSIAAVSSFPQLAQQSKHANWGQNTNSFSLELESLNDSNV